MPSVQFLGESSGRGLKKEIKWDQTRQTATLTAQGFRFGRLKTVVQDSYSWSRFFSFDTFQDTIVLTTAHSLLRDEVWVLDGATGFYVLRNNRQNYSLIHAAGVYRDPEGDIAAQSREFHVSSVSKYKKLIEPCSPYNA